MAIVTTTYRYKPPPKRNGRKLAEITGPRVVTAKGSRRPVGIGEATAAELQENENARPPAGDIQPSTPPATTARRNCVRTLRRSRRSSLRGSLGRGTATCVT